MRSKTHALSRLQTGARRGRRPPVLPPPSSLPLRRDLCPPLKGTIYQCWAVLGTCAAQMWARRHGLALKCWQLL